MCHLVLAFDFYALISSCENYSEGLPPDCGLLIGLRLPRHLVGCAAGKKVVTRSLDGAVLFHDYCASCHGAGGEGNGPAAPALKVSVPNLTLLTKHGGEFPRQRIRNILEGRESLVPHGSQKMPVWGPVFHEIDADQDLGHVRIDNVIKYIESLQKK